MKDYQNYLKNIKGYSPSTVTLYLKYAIELEMFALDYLKMMSKYTKISNNSRRVILSAIKKYLFFLGHENANRIELPKKDVVVQPHVTYQDYLVYIKKINYKTIKGLQKLVVLRILFETGIRASELLNITKEDIIDCRIKIYGKGKRERYVYISKWLKSYLDEFVQQITTERVFAFGYKNLYQKITSLDLKKKLHLIC